MRSLLTLLLLFCLAATVSLAQQRTAPKKPGTTTRKPGTTTRKPSAPRTTIPPPPPPAEVTTSTPVSSQPASLTFPSTEPDGEAMDAAKKQQMYDELHGIKPNTVDPKTKGGKTAKENTKKGKKDQPADTGRSGGRASEETATRSRERTRDTETSGGSDEASSFIGVKAGGNYITFLESVPIESTTYGFHAGVVAQFGKGLLGFQPEILFVSNTTTIKDPVSGAEFSGSSSSLLVPLLARLQFGQPGLARFFVNVGPYGGYSLDDNSDGVIDYGAALGLGMGLPNKSGAKLTIELRGYYGLGSTAAGSEFGSIPGSPVMAQLSIGYLFPLGGR
jgi:hypothetical protein